MSVVLRPYQEKGVERTLANISEGCKAQILSAPTGSGKTEIGMELIRHAIRTGQRAEFVCDRQALVRQTSARFHADGIPHGILMGGETVGVKAEIRVASAQTIQSRGMRSNDLVIADECHEIRDSFLKAVLDSGASPRRHVRNAIPAEARQVLRGNGERHYNDAAFARWCAVSV